MRLDVALTPAEFSALSQRDLSCSACVVFDILRATTCIVTAIRNGASGVLPVLEISHAVEVHRRHPDVLLAGERDGLRITRARSGSLDFHLGNSPREYTPDRVGGRRIVTTTTNGTRALQACCRSRMVLAACFANMQASVSWLGGRAGDFEELVLVCSGTGDTAALEDVLAAGDFINRWPRSTPGAVELSDAALMARQVYLSNSGNLIAAIGASQNGRRLLAMPELAADVDVASRVDIMDVVVVQGSDGWLSAGR